MEDRYKFKFWETKAKVFITKGISITVNTEGRIEPLCAAHRRLEIVMCTGLKDVEGTLIYDGDILDIEGAIGQVSWVDDGWKLVGDGFSGDALFPQIRSVPPGPAMWGKIVGNRFENPV